MTVGMLIGNMMCRSLKKNDINYSKVKKALYKSIAEEGKRTCQLEEDEIKTMFDDTYRYLEQVFSNRSVRDIANDFAKKLQERRTLFNYEVKALLGMLQML